MKKSRSNSVQIPANKHSTNSVVTYLSAGRKPGTKQRIADSQEKLESLHAIVDLEELKLAMQQLPDVNASRLVNLHERIEAGEYSIDSDRLAAKLIDLESSLDSQGTSE